MDSLTSNSFKKCIYKWATQFHPKSVRNSIKKTIWLTELALVWSSLVFRIKNEIPLIAPLLLKAAGSKALIPLYLPTKQIP